MMVDYLRDYPFNPAPETWGLNDVFLDIIKEQEQRWKTHGITWTLGVEREFRFYTPKAFMQFVQEGFGTADETELLKIDKDLAASFSMMREISNRTYTDDDLKALEKACVDNITARKKSIWRSGGGSERAKQEIVVMKSIQKLRKTNPDDYRRELALAYMHLFSESQGGISDLIEYRFGPGRHGAGWYDCQDIVELRTPQVEGAINALLQSQRILWGIKQTALKFGLIPVLTAGPVEPHVHFSFKLEDGENTNYTAFGNERVREFMVNALQGYIELVEQNPALFEKHLPDEVTKSQFMAILPSRTSAIRVCDDNMEARMDISHLARNMALLIAGCGIYAFGANLPAEKAIEIATYIKPMDESTPTKFSTILSTLKNCRIGDDGYLIPDPNTVNWNLDNMNRLLSVDPESVKILIPNSDETTSLAEWRGWHEALCKVRFQDGELDTSEAPTEIQNLLKHMGSVSVTQRPYCHKNSGDVVLTSKTLQSDKGQKLLQEAFGEAHGATVSSYYQNADHEKRMAAATEAIDTLLKQADDLDAPMPDVVEKIFTILQKSLEDIIKSSQRGRDIVIETTALAALCEQRLKTLCVKTEEIEANGNLGNSQFNAIADLKAEIEKPVHDVSRFTKVIVSNMFNTIIELKNPRSELIATLPMLTYPLMIPFNFYVANSDEPIEVLKRVKENFAREFDSYNDDIPKQYETLWARCKQWALNNTDIILERYDPDIRRSQIDLNL